VWRDALRAPDLDEREQNFGRLLSLARQHGGESIRAGLRVWAQGSDDLAWTSRLALRELEQEPTRGPRGVLSPFASLFDESLGQLGHADLFAEIQRRMDQAMTQPVFPDVFAPRDATLPPSAGHHESHSFQFESGPDGVRVRVEEDENGQGETKEYRADTLEELLEEYPELRDRIDIGTLLPRSSVDSIFEGLQLPRGSEADAQPWHEDAAEAELPTDVLGVYLAPKVSPETDGKGGEAEAGTVLRGLLIDRIEPGTIAKALGLRRGDVLLELNGTKLESAADVSRVLRERKAEEDLRVTFTDRRGERRTLTWKPQLGAE
jgi:hypothetical protein